tara:strand:+ start:1106 stop:1246 length:141 start_codon:yes stop_codon:yes gene_type:complete
MKKYLKFYLYLFELVLVYYAQSSPCWLEEEGVQVVVLGQGCQELNT